MGFFNKVKKAFGSKKEDESQNINNKITYEKSSVTDEIIDKTTKFKNFKYLDELIHSGEKKIVLDADITLSDDEVSYYNDGINLNVDDLIIDGNGYSIDGGKKRRIFNCNAKNVTLKNITLKKGYGAKGGAIYNAGELKIMYSTITESKCGVSNHGGAIYNDGKLNVTESTFTDNNASSYGGAIYNDGELDIIKSTFIDNNARSDGGAIYNNRTLNVIDSTLSNNDATSGGGAIYNKGKLVISESVLNENTAVRVSGGAICNRGGELSIIGSALTKNIAKKYCGAAIYNSGVLNISESTIDNNTTKKGGVIHSSEGNFKIYDCVISRNYSPNEIISNNDSLQIYNTDFKNNYAKHIILNYGDKSNLSIFHGKFLQNNAEESVLYNSGKFCSIDRSVFENNLSSPDSINIINKSELTLLCPKITDDGKTILNEKYVLLKKASSDLESKIYGQGNIESIGDLPNEKKFDFGYLDEKIHESTTKEILLEEDILFENYERDYYDGGIELDIDNLVIDGNGKTIDAGDKSRIFIITGKNITLKNIIFKNGHSHKSYDNPFNNHGGAIKINHDINLTIQCCKFISNTSEENGGAIHNNGELTITESLLNENTANYGGAIINTREGNLSIEDSTFEADVADISGGAIDNDGELSIIKTKIISNLANGKYDDGGAIYNKGKVSVTESLFTNNKGRNGGAIHNNGELTITESYINDNTANQGGAIYNNSKLTITGSTLNQNKTFIEEISSNGGAIYNNGKLNMINSTLNQNKTGGAVSSGGAVYNRNEVNITKSILNENSSSKGGAVSNYKGTMQITESQLIKNTGENGGAIHNNNGELTINSSKLLENTTTNRGGAIHNNNGELTIRESYLNENTAKDGGAISNDKGKMNITNSTLNKNIAKGKDKSIFNGGAINNSIGDLKIADSKFTENTALMGGAIYNYASKLNITESTFVNNIAKEKGGAILLDGLDVNKSKCESDNSFKNNSPDNIYEFRKKT